MQKFTCWALVSCALAVSASAAPRFASVFTNGAVLQRGVRVPIWGTAEPDERVTVAFGAASASTRTGPDGRWRVDLPPQEASFVGRTLTASSASVGGHTATVSDVLVGEVWIVCGQSNASFPLCGDNPRYRDREGALVAALTDRPTVRYAVSNGPWTLEPQPESRKPIVWKRFNRANLGNPRGGSCCAYAVTFACALQDALKAPVGLVCAYSGSTPIETWIPRAGFAARVDLRDYLDLPRIPPEKWDDRARNDTFMRRGGFQQPSVMWNARLAPWCPYAVKGVLFYQGCSNSWNAERYLSLQHALYDSWSEKFENGDLRFRYVQVVPWPFLQNCTLGVSLAQAQFAREQTNAAMVVVSDLGNNWDAHPVDKGPVGRRLAALALARDYGLDLAADSPEVRAVRADADGQVSVELARAKELYVYNDDGTVDSPFELAGADGTWHRATLQNVDKQGRLDGTRLVLKAADVAAPQKVRYLQCAPWRSNVFNEMGLPLGVFTADVAESPAQGLVQGQGAELGLQTQVDGSTVFGDARLSVRFDRATGFPTDYAVDGVRVLTGDAAFPSPVVVGPPLGRVPGSETPVAVAGADAPVRVAKDEVRITTRVGDWRIDTFVRLLPETRMVRRRFDVTWLGAAATGKLERVWVFAGQMPCRDGKGAYLLPGRFPPTFCAAKDFRPGRVAWTGRKFASHTPVIASGSDGRSVLSANDETVPFGERTQSCAVERRDGVSLATVFECYGWMPRGVPQRVGDQWLAFGDGDCEAALRRMPQWFAAVGQHVPADRPESIKDVALYSDHPCSVGEVGPAKLGFSFISGYLPYLKALGFNTVWLRPVEDASPYNPRDYYKLQANVGTEDDFRTYVNRAHGLGLRVWRDAVSHGGRNDTVRARAHPEWLARHEDGSVDDFWCYDFYAATWIDYMRAFVRHETAKYGLDGWRLDAPSGSRYPNWSRTIPYARASFAQAQGSLAMTRAMREGLRQANPNGVTLSEAHMSVHATVADAIYDEWGVAANFLSALAQGEIGEVVGQYRRYLHERRWSYVPDQVTMRYTENHDHLSAASVYGKLPALAAFAVQAWIDGIPCVRDLAEEGSFEEYREILRVRNALPELRRGAADYLGVSVPPGVFACRRTLPETESVALVNFNPTAVAFDLAPNGTPVRLEPYECRVVRTKGPSVAAALGTRPTAFVGETSAEAKLPPGRSSARILKLPVAGHTVDVRVELASAESGWLLRSPYDVRLEAKDADGWTLRVLSPDGQPMRGARLSVQVPASGRWYAKTAEGDFNNPQHVRCPAFDARKDYRWSVGHSPVHGARRWWNRNHPFGLTEARAAVGAVLADGKALEFTGFPTAATVEVHDRIRTDAGFTLVLSDAEPTLRLAVRDVSDDATTARTDLTGDSRLSVIAGGWLWDDGDLRVRIRRTGAIDGVWRRTKDGWQRRLRSGELLTTTGTGGTKDCIGNATSVCRQRNDNDPKITFARGADGTVVLTFDDVWLRGDSLGFGRMAVPIKLRETLTLGAKGGFGLSMAFTTGRDIAASEGEIRAEFGAAGPVSGAHRPFALENLAFTGTARGERVEEGPWTRLYWLRKGGNDLPTVQEPSGFSCFVRID